MLYESAVEIFFLSDFIFLLKNPFQIMAGNESRDTVTARPNTKPRDAYVQAAMQCGFENICCILTNTKGQELTVAN